MGLHQKPSFLPRVVAIVLVAAVLPSASGQGVSAADWTPTAPPQIYDPNAGPNAVRRNDYIVDVCQADTDLDCVESIAAYVNNTWVQGTPGTVNNGSSGPETRNWTITGVTALNGSPNLTVMHLIQFTGNLFLQTNISGAGQNGDYDTNSLPRDMKFRAVVRTSWVLPTHVAGKQSGATIKVEKLSQSGASRVTMEGTPIVHMVVLDQSALTSPTGRGDYEVRQFGMTVSDGRFYPIKKDCIEKPTIMTSDNGYGIQLPKFTNGKLDLQIVAPHFRSDGTTEHIGYYEAFVPMETAKCLWGETVTPDSTFEVKVVESESATKSAKTSVEVSAAGVKILASDFTFSSPIVRVTYTAPSPPTTTTTTTTTTTIPVPAGPAKPKGVKVVRGPKGPAVGFARAKGVAYKVVASTGKQRKTLRCTLSKTTVSCASTGLAKGTWTVTITPRQGGVAGTSGSTKLRIP
jgi:hypothetical protein